jgi:hypothetical protein
MAMSMHMNMDMPSGTAAAAAAAAHSTMASDHAMPSMSSMSGMSSTFSVNTRVTLFFTDWTTTTAAAYTFTLFFLFFLGMLNRFLAAFKSQLERKWRESRETAEEDGEISAAVSRGFIQRLVSMFKKTSRAGDTSEETEPLSPMPITAFEQEAKNQKITRPRRRFWIASAPWSISRDGTRALLEFTRALIGYFLYASLNLCCPRTLANRDAECWL